MKDIRDQLIEIQDQTNDINSKLAILNDESEQITKLNENLRHRRDRNHAELQGLSNIRNRRLQTLKKTKPHIYEAVEWLRANRHLFKKDVFEPVCLEVNLTDKRYSDAVESLIGQKDLLV